MKFLKNLISFMLFTLVVVIIVIVAIWLFSPMETRESLYNQSIAKLTGKTYQNTFANSLDKVTNDSVPEHSKRHADPSYVCPMHPQIVKGEPGNCPICGMDLVKKEAPKDSNNKSAAKKKIKYWVAPMDANYRRDEPGKSPMGMDLVPVYEESADDSNDDGFPKITINATTAQNMGVRISHASMQELSRNIKTIGSITYNEDTLHHVHVRAKGWVEKLYTRSLGDPVSKGKTLLEFYSPEILAAQKDLINAKRNRAVLSSGIPRRGISLTEVSKNRLRDLNVPDSLINKIAKTGKSQNRIPVIARHNGVVVKTGIRDGMYITPATEIYTIADLSSVWLIVDVFEHQLSWVNIGDKAEIRVQGVPGKTWTGKVDYIYPELNPKTRTLRVRLKIATPKHQLKPNMFADVTLLTRNKQALTVPAEAIIYYENNPRVVKLVGDNKYQPVEVKVGMKSNGMVEIIKGINDGDKVLVSGQFMIDSESNLQASFRRLSGDGSNGSSNKDKMSKMDMQEQK
jgi:Cu(I)/Ag(I) efflux system membrane fusion protein